MRKAALLLAFLTALLTTAAAGAQTTFGTTAATCTGTIAGTTMTITSCDHNVLSFWMTVSGAGVTAGSYILTVGNNGENTLAGGGPGKYTLSAASTVSSPTTLTFIDCSPSTTVAGGGLTLTAASPGGACRANVGKYSGKWYFTATLNNAPTESGIGVASDPTAPQDATNAANFGGANALSASFHTGLGRLYWNNGFVSPGAGASGKTVAVVINLDTHPWQIWATPDITGTSGFGSGPLWNGDVASSPEVPGSGEPIAGGTGEGFLLPGSAAFPYFNGTAGDSVTYNFATNATLESFIGVGQTTVYQPWNTAGASDPDPGPRHPMPMKIANAPGWAASTSLAAGSRVVAGPGWTPGSPGSFTSGSAIHLWALPVAGTTAGSVDTNFNSCPTPANVGGNLAGGSTGWTSATHFTDASGNVWYCLMADVDYHDMTSAMIDDAQRWAQSTSFNAGDQIVQSDGKAYYEITEITGSPFHCVTSGSGTGPSGTGSSIADGTCHWTYIGTVNYTSGTHRWPHAHEVCSSAYCRITAQANFDVNVTYAYGGPGAPKYQGGVGGERDPIPVQNHSGFHYETSIACKETGLNTNPSDLYGCKGYLSTYMATFQPLAGDALKDNVTAATGPLRPDFTKGVGFYSNSVQNAGFQSGDALAIVDSNNVWKNIQFQATQGIALDTTGVVDSYNVLTSSTSNSNILDGCIVESDGGPGTLTIDAVWLIRNSVIVYGGLTAGSYGVWQKFVVPIYNTTFIGPTGVSNSTAVQGQVANFGLFSTTSGGVGLAPYYNNVQFGFAHGYAGAAFSPDMTGTSATNLAGGASGSFTSAAPGGGTYNVYDMKGMTLFSLTPSNELVGPNTGFALDARIKSTSSALYNAGTNFSYTNGAGGGKKLGGSYFSTALSPGPDFWGSARSRQDIGAANFVTAGTCTINSLSLSGPHTFPGGSTSGYVVGTMSATLTGSCASPTWSITSTGSDHSSTLCNTSSGTDFKAVSDSLELNTTLAAGSYPAICYTGTISGAVNSPFTQAVDLTGTASSAFTLGGVRRWGKR